MLDRARGPARTWTSPALDRLLDAADAALAAGGGGPLVVIAPSDARQGTNALLLAPPAVIEPAFGAASFEAHVRAAAHQGASVQVVADPALGFDLDTPEDLELLVAGGAVEPDAPRPAGRLTAARSPPDVRRPQPVPTACSPSPCRPCRRSAPATTWAASSWTPGGR